MSAPADTPSSGGEASGVDDKTALDQTDGTMRPWTVRPPSGARSGVRAVSVPPEPPVISPTVARALLRLLLAVHAKRNSCPIKPEGTTQQP
jgi:hypothetical protein